MKLIFTFHYSFESFHFCRHQHSVDNSMALIELNTSWHWRVNESNDYCNGKFHSKIFFHLIDLIDVGADNTKSKKLENLKQMFREYDFLYKWKRKKCCWSELFVLQAFTNFKLVSRFKQRLCWRLVSDYNIYLHKTRNLVRLI